MILKINVCERNSQNLNKNEEKKYQEFNSTALLEMHLK